MKVAIPIWANKILPVFDVAENILIVNHENGREIDRSEHPMLGADIYSRISSLIKKNVEVLICGAISLPMQKGLQNSGIEVKAHISGEVNEVLHDFINRIPIDKKYAMPGCSNANRDMDLYSMNYQQIRPIKRYCE